MVGAGSATAGPGGTRVLTYRGERSVPQGLPKRRRTMVPSVHRPARATYAPTSCATRSPARSGITRRSSACGRRRRSPSSGRSSRGSRCRWSRSSSSAPGRSRSRSCVASSSARRWCSGWSRARGSIGCAAGRSSSGRTWDARWCSVRSRSRSRSGSCRSRSFCRVGGLAAILTTFFDAADNAYLPTIVERERPGRRQQRAGGERFCGRVHRLRDQRLPRPDPDRPDRHRRRRRHVSLLGAPPCDDPSRGTATAESRGPRARPVRDPGRPLDRLALPDPSCVRRGADGPGRPVGHLRCDVLPVRARRPRARPGGARPRRRGRRRVVVHRGGRRVTDHGTLGHRPGRYRGDGPVGGRERVHPARAGGAAARRGRLPGRCSS